MTPIPSQQLLQQLQWRYATKQFDPQRRIKDEDWAALEQTLVLTPSSFGLQPWKFVVVRDPAVRAQLLPVSWGQRQVVDASHLVVFAVPRRMTEGDVDALVDRTVEVRGVPRAALAEYRSLMLDCLFKGTTDAARQAWAVKQVYIALGNFLTSAALLGIDACPMEGIDPAKYDEILGLEAKGLTTVVVATAGYRSATDKYAGFKKVRYAKEQLILNA